MNGLQVAAGPALLCMIAWMCFPLHTNTPIVRRSALPPDVFRTISEALPQGWTLRNTSAGAILSNHAGPVFVVCTRFTSTKANPYPMTRIAIERDGVIIADTWALSPVAPQIMASHVRAAIIKETTYHDEIS